MSDEGMFGDVDRLPANIQMYIEARAQLEGHRSIRIARDLTRNPTTPVQLYSADAARVVHLSEAEMGEEDATTIVADLELYQDGSPHILQDDEPLLDEDAVRYHVVISTEEPAFMVYEEAILRMHMDLGPAAAFSKYKAYASANGLPIHYLSEDECKAVLACVRNMPREQDS